MFPDDKIYIYLISAPSPNTISRQLYGHVSIQMTEFPFVEISKSSPMKNVHIYKMKRITMVWNLENTNITGKIDG